MGYGVTNSQTRLSDKNTVANTMSLKCFPKVGRILHMKKMTSSSNPIPLGRKAFMKLRIKKSLREKQRVC